MEKNEFIEVLNNHAENAGIFGNRFVCKSDDKNYWTYHRPAVDTPEPSIELFTEGFVLYSPNIGFGLNAIEKISYEDFITKYNLTRK